MKKALRYVFMWGPLALSVKNWVVDVSPASGLCLQPISRPGDVCEEDLVLVQKYKVRVYKELNRGDVVFLRSPEEPSAVWVRRLVGLEGDWVERNSGPEKGAVKRVPQGHCWLDGQEKLKSSPPRQDCAVPLALLEGRISYVLWPPSRMGAVENYLPHGRVRMTKTAP
ncbi:hypothetical protein BSKO_01411 [Bryopsis sp. KO-2023]|nr:hypothetical protein BSKO_01411 [Bryopsis sp. KO-2023]